MSQKKYKETYITESLDNVKNKGLSVKQAHENSRLPKALLETN